LFFISLKAGGVGLNLTAASYVVLLDPWWNPFAENQAIARAHRIGQKQNVTVVRFIAKDSVEEKILLLQKKKKELAETIIDINYLPSDIDQDLDYILD
jgi:non-specific serine/threonine protein kinase